MRGRPLCLDVVAHAPQSLRRKALAGRQREIPDKTLGKANAQGSAEAFDQNPVGEPTFGLIGQSRDELAEQGVLQQNMELEPGCCRSKLRQQGGIQIRIPDHLSVPRCRLDGPDREARRTKREGAGRSKGRFPGTSLLDL